MSILRQLFFISSILSARNYAVHSFSLPPDIKTTHTGIRPVLKPECYAHQSALEAGFVNIKVASEKKGLGAFASCRIPRGTFLGKYNGELFTMREVKARFWNKIPMSISDKKWSKNRENRDQGITGNYLLEMPNGLFVDAEDGDKSGWCRFMNHASDDTSHCNVKPFMQTETGGETHTFPHMYAIDEIKEGEELCFDYGSGFFLS